MVEYRPVKGYEDYYLVSSDGDIINKITGHVLQGEVKRIGYRGVILSYGEEYKHVLVHRIVAEAFCSKPDGANEVNHINGNKLDNRADNLEWVTRAENLRHAYETGLMPNNAVPRAVIATNMDTGEKMTFPSIYKAARFFNISRGNICMCCKGERPYANGYFWEYQEYLDGE